LTRVPVPVWLAPGEDDTGAATLTKVPVPVWLAPGADDTGADVGVEMSINCDASVVPVVPVVGPVVPVVPVVEAVEDAVAPAAVEGVP
jgi:hypothetical protein